VKGILKGQWSVKSGQKVPEDDDLLLNKNDASTIEGTVLYADLAESTDLVDNYSDRFAAEIYKSFLLCASRIVSSEGGSITAYDGDRIMAVFIGGSKNSSAARCALKINHAVLEVINPAIKECYPESSYKVKHAVGIDTSKLLVARTGIRGSNDLVWVGRAANYAAKLCSLRSYRGSSWVTSEVYDKMDGPSTYSSDTQCMWERQYWQDKGIYVYSSTWMMDC